MTFKATVTALAGTYHLDDCKMWQVERGGVLCVWLNDGTVRLFREYLRAEIGGVEQNTAAP